MEAINSHILARLICCNMYNADSNKIKHKSSFKFGMVSFLSIEEVDIKFKFMS